LEFNVPFQHKYGYIRDDLHSVDFVSDLVVFVLKHTHTNSHTTILRPFFRDHPGEPVPEENFWTLRCKGRLTEADTPTIQLGATPSRLTSAHLHRPIREWWRWHTWLTHFII